MQTPWRGAQMCGAQCSCIGLRPVLNICHKLVSCKWCTPLHLVPCHFLRFPMRSKLIEGLMSMSAGTQHFLYLSGCFGTNLIKGQHDFKSTNCSSTSNEKFYLCFHWQTDSNARKTTRIDANRSAPGPMSNIYDSTNSAKCYCFPNIGMPVVAL